MGGRGRAAPPDPARQQRDTQRHTCQKVIVINGLGSRDGFVIPLGMVSGVAGVTGSRPVCRRRSVEAPRPSVRGPGIAFPGSG
jgi:hypothetical protein